MSVQSNQFTSMSLAELLNTPLNSAFLQWMDADTNKMSEMVVKAASITIAHTLTSTTERAH
ncbi:hypothetical protein P7F88_25200 [Vibrio hannami]|uniref:hypothetical protein n=1 Tax=Vibrio hannami TaxID=2717094 RepID=UPI00240EB93F|nr:hypothetical protein [Vibrio hannami]MDG3089162.1 hypothetical protein [Vibrio hannami]